MALTDLRFFVSDLAVVDSAGALHPVEFTEDSRWQLPGLALVDLEDGESNCVNGTSAMHASLHGVTDIADFVGIRFTVGVPFELNHANPLAAAPPLSEGAMHWHWRSGYKFLRAGVTKNNDGSWLHLGSTACKGTVRDIRSCDSPNRITVELGDFSPSDRIGIDLSALFAGVDLDDGARSDCSSGPGEAECAAMFRALGLPFTAQPGATNSVFRVLH